MDKGLDLKESAFRGADLKLFVRDVRDRQGRKRPITVRSWSTIKDVKDTIQQALRIPTSAQRIYFGPLLTSGKELPNHRTLHDAGIDRSGQTLLLDINGGSSGLSSVMSAYSMQSEVKSDVCISSSVIDATPKLLAQLVQQARRALAIGLKPEFILDGSGGTYFLHEPTKAKIAVFKPADEEPYAENNPRGYIRQAGQNVLLREGVVPGEACIREVAAFMLDHSGFSGVPMTTLVEARHPTFNNNGSRLSVAEGGASIGAHSISSVSKSAGALKRKVGSFQEFVRTECSMDDLSPSMLSVDEVHKIAILDIRLMNADRNSANLLCRRRRDNSIELVPIDHGFCLRSVADVSWMDWCWLDWPQMKKPLSKKTRDYVLKLNIEKDARVLQERLNIDQEALDYFCASCSILKAGVKAGLSLYDIAVMCCRNDNLGEAPSKLEMLFSMAADLAESAIENGRWDHAAASRALAEQLTPKGGSLLNPSGKPVPKSKSALHLPQFSQSLSEFTSSGRRKDYMPNMIQSSASDSSSDSVDGEGEECEEWAAALIADVSMEQSISFLNVQTRSPSIQSDDSSELGLSSSPKGFWTISPGTLDAGFDDSDNDTISWGSPPSDDNFFEGSLSPFSEERHRSYNPFENGRRSSIVLADTSGSPFDTFRKSPSKESLKVSFSECTQPLSEGISDQRLFKHCNSDVGETAAKPLLKRPGNKMKRSQSYSALSSTAEKIAKKEEIAAQTKRPHDHERYRDYFLKFVDLVIVRETTAAARQAKAQR